MFIRPMMTRKSKFRCEAWLCRKMGSAFCFSHGQPRHKQPPPHSYSKGGADGAGPPLVAETYLPGSTKSRMPMVYDGQIMIFHKNIHFVWHQKRAFWDELLLTTISIPSECASLAFHCLWILGFPSWKMRNWRQVRIDRFREIVLLEFGTFPAT